MRIDGFSSQSYPIKRKPRKGQALVDESVDDSEASFENVPRLLALNPAVSASASHWFARKT